MTTIPLQELVQKATNSPLKSIRVSLALYSKLRREVDEGHLEGLVQAIEHDVAAGAYALSYANSAAYRRVWVDNEISDIPTAVTTIGTEVGMGIVLKVMMWRYFDNADALGSYSRRGLWENSIAVATTNKEMRKELGLKGGEIGYTSSLLRNIGILIEEQFAPEQFRQVIERYDKGESLIEAEKGVLGYTHLDVGLRIGSNWSLPIEITTLLGFHHIDFKSAELSMEGIALPLYVNQFSEWIAASNEAGFNDERFDKAAGEDIFSRLMGAAKINDSKERFPKLEKAGKETIGKLKTAKFYID